jgi:hypothetical protein
LYFQGFEGRLAPRSRNAARRYFIELSKNYRFWSDRKRPGLEIKHLGTFSEARTGIGLLRILPRAARAGGRRDDAELLYCVEGVLPICFFPTTRG